MADMATGAKGLKRIRAESPGDRNVRTKTNPTATMVNASASLAGKDVHNAIKVDERIGQSAKPNSGRPLASNSIIKGPRPLSVAPKITSVSLGQKAQLLASYDPRFADLVIRAQGHAWVVHRSTVFPQSAKLQAMCSNKRDDSGMFVIDFGKEQDAILVQYLLQMMYFGADTALTKTLAESVRKLACIYDLARKLDAFLVMEIVLAIICPSLRTVRWYLAHNQDDFCQIVEILLRSSQSNEPSRSLCVEIIMQQRVALQSSGLLARLMVQDAELNNELVSVMVGSSEKRAQYHCHGCVSAHNLPKAATWKAQKRDTKCIACQAAAYETGLWKGKS